MKKVVIGLAVAGTAVLLVREVFFEGEYLSAARWGLLLLWFAHPSGQRAYLERRAHGIPPGQTGFTAFSKVVLGAVLALTLVALASENMIALIESKMPSAWWMFGGMLVILAALLGSGVFNSFFAPRTRMGRVVVGLAMAGMAVLLVREAFFEGGYLSAALWGLLLLWFAHPSGQRAYLERRAHGIPPGQTGFTAFSKVVFGAMLALPWVMLYQLVG